MIKLMETKSNKAIAFEIIGAYETSDEKKLEKFMNDKIKAGINQINILAKIDKMELSKSSWKAMWDDGMYAMTHFKHCGKIAIVSNKDWEAHLVKLDNLFFENKKAGRQEKYFDISDLPNALGWVNE